MRGKNTLRFARNNFVSKFRSGQKVALVSSDKYRGKVSDDLFLQRTLIKAGAKAEIISWQNKSIDYRKYDKIVITSMWGYQNHLDEFYDWIKKVESSKTPVFNPIDVILDNCDKEKQLGILDKNGIPYVKTEVVTRKDLAKASDFPFVLKPVISASGQGVKLINNSVDLAHATEYYEQKFPDRKLLKQEYRSEIKDGELSVILIKGEIMNLVRRFPGVIEGKGNRVVAVKFDELDDSLAELAHKVASLKEYKDTLYLRVDTVKVGASYLIMEVEAFEPQLFYYLLDGNERQKMLEKMVRGILE